MNKILIIVVCCLLFVVCCLAGSYFFIDKEIRTPFKTEGEEIVFEVKEGDGVKEIARNLEKIGLIKNNFYFLFQAFKTRKEKEVLAGNYCLSPKMSISEILETLTTEEKLVPSFVKLTFPEGWTIKKIEERLKTKGLIEEGDILKFTIKDFKKNYPFLIDAPDKTSLEGYLFPDTYFFHCSSPEILCKEGKGEIQKCGKSDQRTIIEKFLSNFDEKLTSDLRNKIQEQHKTIFEVITMASILEKEVNTKEDREIVSGIFWKRLKGEKPLQSCATIAYILGVDKWRYSFEDTRVESPYNTYLNKDLPPAPISNPGLESIQAAISPKRTDYNYFLTDPKTGKTIFAKTIEEHNKNKNLYFQ